MRVKELMKQAVVVDKDISLTEAARIMSEKNIGSLLFVGNDRIKGIVTERDVLKNFGGNEKISKIMSTKLVIIEPNANINEALEIMKKNNIKRLPVVSNNKLIGIISLTDIAAHVEDLEGDFFF